MSSHPAEHASEHASEHAATKPVVERRRRLDWASVLLLATGLICGTLALRLVIVGDQNPLIVIPALLAVITGARHLTKWEARELTAPR